MSKQLALSSAFSVFAMAAFLLSSTGEPDLRGVEMLAGAAVETATPAIIRIAPAFSN